MKVLFLITALTFINSIALAKDIGTVTFLRGNAWVIRGQDKISVEKDLILQTKDEVFTEKRIHGIIKKAEGDKYTYRDHRTRNGITK